MTLDLRLGAGDTGAEPSSNTVRAELARLVANGTLRPDRAQAEAANLLDGISEDLAAREGTSLLGQWLRRPNPVRGAYLWGEVGRGKTLLMDLFFAAAPVAGKRRVHFDEFMDEMHRAIADFRATARGRDDDADPVAAVVRPMLPALRLLCLDEFQVSDITNAMLLQRLFEKLFAGGVVLVATSNTPPEKLYWNGLNRQLFLPFVGLLKAHTQIFQLGGETDYRRLKFAGREVYSFGTGEAAKRAMDDIWQSLAGGSPGAPVELDLPGRRLSVPRAALGAARFSFAQLCEQPLGARDYLKLAQNFESIVLDAVPEFDPQRSDAAKRFILLIDTLYDRGVKLAASFAVPIDALCSDARMAGEFARTASRLIEMASETYLEASRKAAPRPAAQGTGAAGG